MPDFDYLFRKYHRRLLLFTMKFVERESDALDIVQNVFVSIWENGKYKQNEELVKSYLFSAIKNSCLNYIKHQKIRRNFENEVSFQLKEMEAIHYQTGEKTLIEKESLMQIYTAIDSLADKYKVVISLSRLEGYKNKEIAEKLQIPVRTVETRIFRALTILKDKISNKSFIILLNLNQLHYSVEY